MNEEATKDPFERKREPIRELKWLHSLLSQFLHHHHSLIPFFFFKLK